MKSRVLIRLLADGQVHSGESLAARLGVSRTAVWKQIKRAEDEGFSIDSIRGKGYRLVTAIDLLDSHAIVEGLPEKWRSSVALQVFDELDSTNAEILRQLPRLDDNRTPVCLADHQTAGRGRRGRDWQSPQGENVYLSLGLTFRGGFSILDGLSLVLGLAVAEALEQAGAGVIRLKWPNDLFINEQKLAGILVELQGELEEGTVQVVAGIGINVHMSKAEAIDQAWTSLSSALPTVSWQRNQIVSSVIGSVLDATHVFSETGFSGFSDAWLARDMFLGRPVRTSDGRVAGKGAGVDQQGNYLVDVGGHLEKVRAGELSLRAVS